MIHSGDFYDGSVLSDQIFEMMTFCDEDTQNAIFDGFIEMVCKQVPGQTEIFIRLINHLKERRYPEARKLLGIGSDYMNYSDDIYRLRYNIKYLLTGLISTSAITTYRFFNYPSEPFAGGTDHYGTAEYYKPVALEYNKVTDMKEMNDFNEYFHNYLIGLAFRISDIYTKRMAYTIQYLQNENLFPDMCKEAMITLNKFELQLEELR